MAWSITIGTVKGTVIRLHITFLDVYPLRCSAGSADAAVRDEASAVTQNGTSSERSSPP
jgi:hypothetical protein